MSHNVFVWRRVYISNGFRIGTMTAVVYKTKTKTNMYKLNILLSSKTFNQYIIVVVQLK